MDDKSEFEVDNFVSDNSLPSDEPQVFYQDFDQKSRKNRSKMVANKNRDDSTGRIPFNHDASSRSPNQRVKQDFSIKPYVQYQKVKKGEEGLHFSDN